MGISYFFNCSFCLMLYTVKVFAATGTTFVRESWLLILLVFHGQELKSRCDIISAHGVLEGSSTKLHHRVDKRSHQLNTTGFRQHGYLCWRSTQLVCYHTDKKQRLCKTLFIFCSYQINDQINYSFIHSDYTCFTGGALLKINYILACM